METTIQIVVAGSLLLAWIWVLGRPLVTPQARPSYDELDLADRGELAPTADLSPDGSDFLDIEPSVPPAAEEEPRQEAEEVVAEEEGEDEFDFTERQLEESGTSSSCPKTSPGWIITVRSASRSTPIQAR